jgi:hypothetical protein
MINERQDFLKEKRLKRSKNYLIKSSRWLLIELERNNYKDTISISELITIVSEGAFYFILLLFAFPVSLPLPYPPGLPSLCGIPIFLLSIQMAINRKAIILPKFIKEYRIKVSLIKLIIHKSTKIFKLLSKIIKVGRLEFLTKNYLIPLYGVFAVILALCILLPFPGTNLVPAIAIFLLCLGLMFHDGLFIIIANIVGFLGLFIVYWFSAYFASLVVKVAKATYSALSSLYLQETTVAFMLGMFVGMIGMFLLVITVEIIFKKVSKKRK